MFLGICLICATFGWNVSVSEAVVEISEGSGKIANTVMTVYDFFHDDDSGSWENWKPQPDEVVPGTDGASVSAVFLQDLFEGIDTGARKIYYVGRWSFWNADENLYYFDVDGTLYYFRVSSQPFDTWFDIGNGQLMNIHGVHRVYYIGTSYVAEWKDAGEKLFDMQTQWQGNRPFPKDVVIDVSQNGY